MVKLTQLQRYQIAALYNEGKTYTKIMHHVGCSRSSIVKWKNDLNRSKPFQEKKRPGRSKKISSKIERKIINTPPVLGFDANVLSGSRSSIMVLPEAQRVTGINNIGLVC